MEGVLRKLRRERNFTQREMAEVLGISVPAYHKIETSITKIKNEKLIVICNKLGITVNEFQKYLESENKGNLKLPLDNESLNPLLNSEIETLKKSTEEQKILIEFIIDALNLETTKSIGFVPSLFQFIQEKRMYAIPEKYNDLLKWQDKNLSLLGEELEKGKGEQWDFTKDFPPDIKKLSVEYENRIYGFILKGMYERSIFLFLKSNNLLTKEEIKDYNKFKKYTPF